MSRRVSLPGASELFGGAAPKQTRPEKRTTTDGPSSTVRSRTAVVDDRKSTYSSQAAIVVRVRNGAGQEVQKLSQRYQLSGDARDVEAARQGDIIFYRELDLQPGVYTIESIDVLLADFVDHGPDSVLVRRLKAAELKGTE